MKTTNQHLDRLFKAAARAPQYLPSEAPFALEIRVLGDWRSPSHPGDVQFLEPLLRWAFVCACLFILASVALNYQSLREAGPNVLSMADSAIKMSLLP